MTDYNTPAPLRKRNHTTDSTSPPKKSKSNVETPLAHKSHDSKVMHAHYAEDSMIPTQIDMTNDGENDCEISVTQKKMEVNKVIVRIITKTILMIIQSKVTVLQMATI